MCTVAKIMRTVPATKERASMDCVSMSIVWRMTIALVTMSALIFNAQRVERMLIAVKAASVHRSLKPVLIAWTTPTALRERSVVQEATV